MTLVVVERDGSCLFNWEEIAGQSEVWIDRYGDYHRVEEMTPTYRANALRWLIQIIGPQLLETAIECYMTGRRPQGEHAQDAFDDELDQLLRMTPEDFILETELGRALST